MHHILPFFMLGALGLQATESSPKRYSTAGFYATESSPRTVHALNPQWSFHLGAVPEGAKPYAMDYDDSAWEDVNLPHGLELLPLDASGGVNYQGEAWYRKWVELPTPIAEKRHVIYFEGIMGKSRLYLNGELLHEHFGGFLPMAVDITDKLKPNQRNLITIWADNSDDPICPPGKAQAALDFCYFGGIYRDAWLISTSREFYVTDENMTDKVAGGGMLVATIRATEAEADVEVKLDIAGSISEGKARLEWIDKNGIVAQQKIVPVKLGENKINFKLLQPALWSPENPHLYTLRVSLFDTQDRLTDDFTRRVGVRHIQLSEKEGFILNGKPYPYKLIGANRHQDYGYIGNALSNSLHWRDAIKLKDLGMNIIRNAHYSQDPAFMDACDELGLFVIVNSPGWQHWSKEPIFAERVKSDIAEMVRRDRSRPSVIMWEPMLNETWGDEGFVKDIHHIVKAEMPYEGSNYTAIDEHYAKAADDPDGKNGYDVIYLHPNLKRDTEGKLPTESNYPGKVTFTREWGDNVDDWFSHNSTSRTARNWGEVPQIIQSKHYAAPNYDSTNYRDLLDLPKHHLGGALWHSFDHQRGYHPDPFYGGLWDALRREKISAAMFRAQSPLAEPHVYIANELTPFSPQDITIYSNCPRVRLTSYIGDRIVKESSKAKGELWFTFNDIWDHQKDKAHMRAARDNSKKAEIRLVVEGLDAEGKVIASETKRPARRAVKLQLQADTMGISPVADGGDLFLVTASITDELGATKRLNNSAVQFSIEGEGELVCSPLTMNNPAQMQWGEASILVRTTEKAGDIKISVQPMMKGVHTAKPASLSIKSIAPQQTALKVAQEEKKQEKVVVEKAQGEAQDAANEEKAKRAQEQLREVEKQQEAFGEQR